MLQLAAQRGVAITKPRSRRLQGVQIEVLGPCRASVGSTCLVESRADWRHNDNSLVLRLRYAGRTVLLPGDLELAGELALLEQQPEQQPERQQQPEQRPEHAVWAQADARAADLQSGDRAEPGPGARSDPAPGDRPDGTAGEPGEDSLGAADRREVGPRHRLSRAAAADSAGFWRADVLKAPHHCSRTSSSESFVTAVRPQWVICSLGAYNRYRFPHLEVLQRYRAVGSRVLRTDADGAVEVRIDAAGTLRGQTFARPQ